ncbi:DNA polymerase III PolC-type-like [Babylonia areolata]|uniref:DNA polymerase III PolC-type-like n=1 Tax=Babylonia areolata TaxID=304850 RepID=UPI003FD030FD
MGAELRRGGGSRGGAEGVGDATPPPSHRPQPRHVVNPVMMSDLIPLHGVRRQPRHGVRPQPRHGVRPQPRHGVRPKPRHSVRPKPRQGVRPKPRPVNTEDRRFVFFDLETTGLDPTCHITQIAAQSGQDRTFSSFVLPEKPISLEAQAITGITCVDQQMYHHGDAVESLTITRALEAFIAFLGEEPVVLIGHNIKTFDCPRLLNALTACGLVERFGRAVHGFVDTLPLFREICPRAANHRQPTLVRHYLGKEYPAHDAREDVKALQQVVDRARPGHDVFTRHSFTLEHIIELQQYHATWA